jgi:hypothetical protein
MGVKQVQIFSNTNKNQNMKSYYQFYCCQINYIETRINILYIFHEERMQNK